MKISIVIPVFNQAEYLADAIESALDQTIPCEIIVVNDGSTDNSLEVAKYYESKGVKVINQVNKGLPTARNVGIMNMTGDYLLPLDADDILKENAVEVILSVIEATGADIVAPSFKTFGVMNEFVTLMPNPTLEDFKTANRIGYFSAIKKEALLEVGAYSPKMLWGYEDFHLWFELLTRGKKLVTIPEPLVLYRTKEKSMIHTALAHHDELILQIMKDFPEVYAAHG